MEIRKKSLRVCMIKCQLGVREVGYFEEWEEEKS